MDQIIFDLVGDDVHFYLGWLSAFFDRVNLTVVTVTQSTVLVGSQEADRMCRMVCYLFAALAGQVILKDIEAAFFFTQIVKGISVRRPYRIAVFSTERGNLFECTVSIQCT